MPEHIKMKRVRKSIGNICLTLSQLYRTNHMKKTLLSFALLISLTFSFSQLRLPSLVGDNMVLQQQSSVMLWGWSNPSQKIIITTSWNNKTDSVAGTRDAKWKMMVQTPAAGGPYTISIKADNDAVTLKNVFIGEVWVCSGQSNMEYNSYYKGSTDIQPELKKPANNNIHLFLEPKATAIYPQDDCKAKWTIADSNSLKSFSEAAYFFAQRINHDLNVPVGLIEAAWGGTPAETWTPAAVVNTDEALTEAARKQTPADWWPYWPGYAYNAMISPITNYNIAGALWYQGEGNTAAPYSYSKLLTAMIKSWRNAWNKDFPFYLVQIAPFTYGSKYIGSVIQEQQAKVLALENTGMVVTTDIVPDTTDIHPPQKKAVGDRLAALALAKTYHKTGMTYASPMYKNISMEGNKATIIFDNADEGLMMKGSSVSQLYVAGNDKIFYPAEAKIIGNKLMVSSDKVKKPVAVRFGFSNAAVGNLFSKNGLPVAPFRTDDWDLGINSAK
jgi:sialate O-acetylesterase